MAILGAAADSPAARPPADGPSPCWSSGRPSIRLKRDWLTGGFVPSHGGIGSFLPMLKPATPSAGQQSRLFRADTHYAAGQRPSSSRRSDRSSTPRANLSSRGSNNSRSSKRNWSRAEPFSRFSGALSAWSKCGEEGNDRVNKLVACDSRVGVTNLRHMLTLNAATPGQVELEAAVPDFLLASLREFSSAPRPRNQPPMTPRLLSEHDSKTAKGLLRRSDLLHWGPKDGGAHLQRARTTCELPTMMRAAMNIGLRAEVEACASTLLQACVRSHIARNELRLKRQVAVWAQKCYHRVRQKRHKRAQREAMGQYRCRVAQSQYSMRPEENASTDRQTAEARVLKQRQWRIVNDRFHKYKMQRDEALTLDQEEQTARDLEQKRAKVEAVRLQVAEEKTTFLTDAKRTVWIGHVPLKYASKHVMRPLMERLGKVISVHVRTKKDTNGIGSSWVLVMFEDRQTAENSLCVDMRTDCGLGTTKDWKFCIIQPEKIESIEAKIALADMQVDGLVKEKEIRRQQAEIDSIAKAEARKREHAERERRATDISATWETINREQQIIQLRDRQQREVKQDREERKLYHQLLSIVLNVWFAYASTRTRLDALDKTPKIRQKTMEMAKAMKAGKIPVGRRDDSPPTTGGPVNELSRMADKELLKWNPGLFVTVLNSFFRQKATLIRSFVSWKIYMQALSNDVIYHSQISKSVCNFSFYKCGVRNFGIQVKLDKIEGLRDLPSRHEWQSPRDRHEQSLSWKPDGSATGTPCATSEAKIDSGSDYRIEGKRSSGNSNSNCTTEESELAGLSRHSEKDHTGREKQCQQTDWHETSTTSERYNDSSKWSEAEVELVASMFPGALSTA